MMIGTGLRGREIDEGAIREAVRGAFEEKFAGDFVRDIFVGKYPEGYSVVVYVRDKEDLGAIMDVADALTDRFDLQGLPVAVSTRARG